jgi:peptide/nickel transport system substrate-binding protein
MRVRMPALNAALDAALAEVDDAKRTALFQQVAKVFNSELPWAPLWVQRRYGIVSTAVRNFVWTPSPGGGSYDQHAENWAFG